jgi:hypothetical protein
MRLEGAQTGLLARVARTEVVLENFAADGAGYFFAARRAALKLHDVAVEVEPRKFFRKLKAGRLDEPKGTQDRERGGKFDVLVACFKARQSGSADAGDRC